MKRFWSALCLSFLCCVATAQEFFTIQGFVRDSLSRETLPGVHVYVQGTQTGTITNSYGFYSITLPPEATQLVFSFVGFGARVVSLPGPENLRLDINLYPSLYLEEVTVVSERSQVALPTMGLMRVPISQIENVPAIMGERDVMKALQLLPGVQRGTEGTGGLYVRGGGHDQNLIILDDAKVYNANHLFGFFSVFNANAIKDVKLWKGGFPARYGGRLSSVVDITMRDGNMKEFDGEVGIGLIASRFTLEGPLKRDRSSFLIAGRRTYFDLLFAPLMPDYARVGYYFYDLNTKFNYVLNDNNRLFISGFFGRNNLFTSYDEPFEKVVGGLNWHNALLSARLSSLLPGGLFVNNSLIFSQYQTGYYTDQLDKQLSKRFLFDYRTGIRDYSFKSDFMFNPWPNHTFRFGGIATAREFRPRMFEITNEFIDQHRSEIERQWSFESALYVENEFVRGNWMYNIGMRLSYYNTMNRNWLNPEPRVTLGYLFSPFSSIKASYSVMNQRVHLLSSTGGMLPTDLWLPATPDLLSQHSRQFSLGWNKRLDRPGIDISLEAYYKESENILTYRDGANFFFIDEQNPSAEIVWADNVAQGSSDGFGVELLVHRKQGRLNGWFSYTWSKADVKFPEINNGLRFPADFDRRHNLSLTLAWNVSPRFQVSSSWVFMSGHPITLPFHTSRIYRPFDFDGQQGLQPWGGIDYISQRNNFRTQNYHRLDLSFRFIRQRRRSERVWEIGIYNAYSRMNPFSYTLDDDFVTDRRVLRKTTLFPFIPSVTYLVRF